MASDDSNRASSDLQDAGADGGAGKDTDIGDDPYDAGPLEDAGDLHYDGPPIPETCEQAAQATTTVGCLFYAVDLDSYDNANGSRFAVVISNPNLDETADVMIQKWDGSAWSNIESTSLPPMNLESFKLPNMQISGSGNRQKGAYRIESTIPVVVYQFNPLNKPANPMANFSSDASLLIPATAASSTYFIINWERIAAESNAYSDYFTVVGLRDGTKVTISPSAVPMSGGVVQPTANPFTVDLDEGDVVEVATADVGASMIGSVVESDKDHPVAVFVGHQCAHVPANVTSCDHMEEQLPGLRFWGKEILAARVALRNNAGADPVIWQIFASRDGTVVSFSADAKVKGLPNGPIMLNRGEHRELTISGSLAAPGDFLISATEPVGVMQYMTGSRSINAGLKGDPSSVYAVPIEQFLPRYVFLVPTTWSTDYAVITRKSGTEAVLDGEPMQSDEFTAVPGSGYEVARVRIEDGVHTLEGPMEEGLGLIIVGWDFADSYAFAGGMGLYSINSVVR